MRPQLGTWPATQTCVLTGNWTSDLSVPRPALNPLSHTSQGPILFFIKVLQENNLRSQIALETNNGSSHSFFIFLSLIHPSSCHLKGATFFFFLWTFIPLYLNNMQYLLFALNLFKTILDLSVAWLTCRMRSFACFQKFLWNSLNVYSLLWLFKYCFLLGQVVYCNYIFFNYFYFLWS